MNIATIGTSIITNSFIDAARQVDGVDVTAVYSRGEKRAKEFADEHGVTRYFTDINLMAEDERIDCVYIASPNSLHFEQTLLMLESKKHVICEKPIFANINEWEKAFQVAEENGVFLFEAIRNVYMPNFIALKDNLNKVGKIRSVNFSYSKYSSRYDNVLNGEKPNIFSLDYAGGALVDLGVYPLAAVIALFGRPKHATYYPVIIETGVDGSGTLLLKYDDFVCTILTSKVSTTYNCSEIQGSSGTFTIDHLGTFQEVHYINLNEKDRETINEKQTRKDMAYEVEAFYDVIQSHDVELYGKMKQLSYDVLSITEEVRKGSGIIFSREQ